MCKIILTGDGSATLINETTNEHYHSTYGAVQESEHIFINAGLKFKSKSSKSLNILEVGLGTGLNALLTLLEACTDPDYGIYYTGIEPYPVKSEIAEKLNYCEYLKAPGLRESFQLIHNSQEDILTELSSNFHFRKIISTFELFQSEIKFDIVYFDAFSPINAPHLWTDAVFRKVHSMMNKGGILVTYCSKGIVRRRLQSCNFIIERLKGPPGKHEILRATAD